jgi:hypothetical protein
VGFGLWVFLAVVYATFFMNALHWYTQVQTYPLFAWVPKGEFVHFHQEYERRLPVALYAPYALLMVSNAVLFFVPPEGVGILWVLALFLLNACIAAESLAFAAPVHRRMDREGKDEEAVRKLVNLNSFRLAAGTVSSLIALYLLAGLLMG